MKLFGSLKELVSAVFRKDSQEITVRPNQSTTYTAARDVQLPQQDSNAVLVSRNSTDTLTNKTLTSPAITTPTGLVKGDVGLGNVDNTSDATKDAATTTLTNKTISGASNTLTNIPAATAITGQLPTANGGTGQNSTATFPTSGVVVTEGATQTLSNKTLDSTSSIVNPLAIEVIDNSFVIKDNGDNTKQLKLDVSPIPTATQRTLTVPSTGGNILVDTATQTITNKDIDGGTASDSSRITVPKAGTATLSGLTRKEGTLVYDTDLDKLFIDSGSALVPVGSSGSGSGEVNAVLNPSASDDLTGYTAGTSHTNTRVTSGSPLAPVTSTAISVSASATATESATSGSIYTITTQPTALRNKKLKVEFYFTTEASQTWALSVRSSGGRMALSTDSSGATLLPAGTTGKFTTTFDADASTSYTVHLTRTAGSGTATLIYTSLIVGPGIQPQGAVVGEWQTYSPTFSASFGTVTNPEGYFRRVGSNLEVTVYGRTGTVTSAVGTISLPSGLTIDLTKVRNATTNSQSTVVGNGSAQDSLNAGITVVVNDNVATNVLIVQSGLTSSEANRQLSATLASNFEFSVRASVPIAEWAGSGTVNLLSDNVIQTNVRVQATGTSVGSTASVTEVTAVYPTEVKDTHNAYNPSTGVFTAPVAGDYNVDARFGWDGASTSYVAIAIRKNATNVKYAEFVGGNYAAISGVVSCVAGDTIEIRTFYSSGTSPRTPVNTASTQTLDIFRIADYSAGEPVGFGTATSTARGLVYGEAEATNLTITNVQSIPGLTVIRQLFRAYQTASGKWFLKMNLTLTGSGGSASNIFEFSVSGVVFKNTGDHSQTIPASTGPSGFNQSAVVTAYTIPNTNQVRMYTTNIPTFSSFYWNFNGEVELESKPTWA